MNGELFSITPQKMMDLILHHIPARLSDEELEQTYTAARLSEPLVVLMFEGKPLCFYGLVPQTLFSDIAHLWMLTINPRGRTMFARHSKKEMSRLLNAYPTIFGYCTTASAVRWLRWLGASFTQVGDAYRFEIRRG